MIRRCTMAFIFGALGLIDTAHASLLTYDFNGNITEEDTTGPLRTLLNPNFNTSLDAVTGSFSFDPTTLPSSPGNWALADAVFHARYAGGPIDAIGATAHVTSNQDQILFSLSVPVSEFPAMDDVTSATIGIGFETFTDGYFSLSALPVTVPPNDHTLGFSYSAGGAQYGASTDTNFRLTATLTGVPAPAPAISLAVATLAAIAARRVKRPSHAP